MKRWLTALSLIAMVAFPSFAQIDTASIEAFALDQSKAPLPGVTVTVTRPETGYQNVAVTDSAGSTRFPALAPATYEVQFTLEGFAPVAAQRVVLRIGQQQQLNVVMQAAASETITVRANDPADMEAEYGYARGHERYRLTLSGIFHAPWRFTIAPIYEYGSGQPWTRRLGYDFNGDGKNSDRPAGAGRNEESGPPFRQLSLRLTKAFGFAFGQVELIGEAFNLTDVTNYDPSSIVAGEYLSGPTAANPAAPYVANPRFGQYLGSLPLGGTGREFQLGVRWVF
ncbi:MAG TPA: carboxypeptidase-like regulatory domain-containing protein [Thermoanaerobaculia bacterium]|nr:carboxypeptidase-like regulatory domain-containing protein [Thermoanaerobaculia bacterium]